MESARWVKRKARWPLNWIFKDNRICSGEWTLGGKGEARGEGGAASGQMVKFPFKFSHRHAREATGEL